MTAIKTNCPLCGVEVDLTPADIEMRVDDREMPGPDSYYAFECPKCLLNVRKLLTKEKVKLLEAAGVKPIGCEPNAPNSAPLVITAVEAIGFLDTLSDDGRFQVWLQRLRSLVHDGRDQDGE